MYKNIRQIIIYIMVIALTFIIITTSYINNKAWDEILNNFVNEKTDQTNYFFSKINSDLNSILENNAYWSEAEENLLMKNEAWLKENATEYVVKSNALNIDFMFISNEDKSYQEVYGSNLKNLFINSSIYNSTLVDNNNNNIILWKDSLAYFVNSSPFLSNDLKRPLGIYAVGRKIDTKELDTLKDILGKNQITYISITPLAKYPNIFTHDFRIIKVSIPVKYGENSAFVNINFNLPIYNYLFKKHHYNLLMLIFLFSTFVITTELYFFKKISIYLTGTIKIIKRISKGNFNEKLYSRNNTFIPELTDLSTAINNMSSNIENKIEQIDYRYLQMIDLVVNAMEVNDSYTHEHSHNVSKHALRIAKVINYDDLESVEIAGKFHDIGKISVPSAILNKPGKLTKEEYEIIKKHPEEGYKIIKNSDFNQFIKDGVLYHHEKYNGMGYPKGLKGDQIPFIAQIIAVADVYDALTSNRAYRKSMTKNNAISIMKEEKGKQLNPELVDIFINIIKNE
ncbi:HD domain-containing phosphohydrolase [Helicovermis profundi]|uniref:HD-GYP domain-containing protein n=1 Tax=Helicovermis profundi TaxID=3065157 RepID=A0AAU9E1W2_9FIRM|nr:hypothetical protein HLPR_06290 [Clostridia bacterium S502]